MQGPLQLSFKFRIDFMPWEARYALIVDELLILVKNPTRPQEEKFTQVLCYHYNRFHLEAVLRRIIKNLEYSNLYTIQVMGNTMTGSFATVDYTSSKFTWNPPPRD